MKLKITVDGKTYEVEVEASEPEPQVLTYVPMRPVTSVPSAVPVAAPRPHGSNGVTVADESKGCRSPISGTVVRVNAQPGKELQVGDILGVLEAMKMETNITAPAVGKVSDIKVQVGDPVQSGQVVVEFA